MNILVLNCGSSSIKYKLYDMTNEAVLAQGGVERIGINDAFIKVKLPNGEKKKIMADLPTHKEGVQLVFKCLLDPEFGAIKSLDEIGAVGHRVVTVDLHAGQIQGFFDIPVDHLAAAPALAEYFQSLNLENVVVVSPDLGGVTRARNMADLLGTSIAIVEKRRPRPGCNTSGAAAREGVHHPVALVSTGQYDARQQKASE